MPRKVVVVAYDPAWPALAAAESARLRASLDDNVLAIHHFGSTAVPGLCAKPVLDLLPVVADLDRVDCLNDRLIALGYTPRGEYGLPGRRYFPRILADAEETHTHHVHFYPAEHPEVHRHLAVRDFLRAHPAEAEAYGRLKTSLAARFPWDIDGYVDGKDAYMKDLERRAMVWAAAGGRP
ncbi:MAG: GrpB family protein [Anaerolineales bacterium]|nr:GrpB family protein [Anaerolineales bacterium]